MEVDVPNKTSKVRLVATLLPVEQAERFRNLVESLDLSMCQVLRKLVLREMARLERQQQRRAGS